MLAVLISTGLACFWGYWGASKTPRRLVCRKCLALLDLNSRTLEVYTQPQNDDYASLETLSATDHVTLTFNAQAVASLLVADLLP